MGCVTSKCHTKVHEVNKQLRDKILVLEEEMEEMRCRRENEAWAYEQHLMVFAAEDEEWKRERQKQKEEVARLRKILKEEEERRRRLEHEAAAHKGDKEWYCLSTGFLMECMEEEQTRREEAVEKWKQLYLTIKTELDDLIQWNRQGERFGWGAEEGMIERLEEELRDGVKTVEMLRSRIAVMEKEGSKKDREIDILRQSLRILSNTRGV